MKPSFPIEVSPEALEPEYTGKDPSNTSTGENDLVRYGDTIVFRQKHKGYAHRLKFDKELFERTDQVDLDDSTSEVSMTVRAIVPEGTTKTYKLDLSTVPGVQVGKGQSIKHGPFVEKGGIVVVGGNGPVPDPDEK